MHAHIHMPPNLGLASCGCSLIAGLKEESSSGSRDPVPQGEYRGLNDGSNSPQSGPYTTLGERHKEIKR